MTTPTGTISLSNVNTELGKAAAALITMNDANVRTLAVKTTAGSTISMNDLRGKTSGAPTHTFTFYDSNYSPITSINEGSTFYIGLVSIYNPESYTYYNYTITGVSSADLSSASLTGSIQESGSYVSYTVAADATTEGTETLTITLNAGQGAIATKTLTINDTSTTPAAATYSLTRSVASVNEGGSFTITFATNQAGNFAYTITGVSSADIGNASLTGTVSNGSVLTYNVTADATTEGTETFTITLNNGQASTSVTINDTSQTPAGGGGGAQGTPVTPTAYNGGNYLEDNASGYAKLTLTYGTDGVFTIVNQDLTLILADLFVTPQGTDCSGYWVQFDRTAFSDPSITGSATPTTGWLQLNQARSVEVINGNSSSFSITTVQASYTVRLSTSSSGSPVVSTNTIILRARTYAP